MVSYLSAASGIHSLKDFFIFTPILKAVGISNWLSKTWEIFEFYGLE
jgi:hypothetical protein